MEITPYLPDLFKLSPIVGLLSLILFVFWNYFKNKETQNLAQIEKKDSAILTLMTDHSAKLLEMQEKTILSNNQIAASHVQLSTSIDRLNVTICDNQETLLRELDELKGSRKVRVLNGKAQTSVPVDKKAQA